MSLAIDFDPDVFHGELTANRAQIFIRCERRAEWGDCTLSGYVHGPRCELAHTLPARFTLTDLGAGPTLLARTTITDPCFWTSDLPQIYDAHVELRRGGEVLAKEQRMLGLRSLGVRQGLESGRLIRESKAWVPRGVELELLEPVDVAELREQLLTAVVASPSLDLLVEASRRGLYLIARIDGSAANVPQQLRSLSRWPAVMMAVIQGGGSFEKSLQQVAPNLLLVQAVSNVAATNASPAPWAHLQWVEAAESGDAIDLQPAKSPLPLLIAGGPNEPATAAVARSACDRLQSNLAPRGQFAGYFITSGLPGILRDE